MSQTRIKALTTLVANFNNQTSQIRTDADELHPDVMPIIFSYLDDTIHTHSFHFLPFSYIRNQLLINYLCHLYQNQANLAALRLVQGDLESTEALVKINPDILYFEVELTDHRGNKLRGTLLEIASLLGDCNVTFISKDNHGSIERLSAYLPKDEAIKQLQATRPPGWKEETEARMKPYIDAAKDFLYSITHIQHSLEHDDEAYKTACAEPIATFQETILKIPSQQPVITTGLIFDIKVIIKALDMLKYKKSSDDLVSQDRHTLELFKNICFGTLLNCASTCDLQLISTGLTDIIYNDKPPERSLFAPESSIATKNIQGVPFYTTRSEIRGSILLMVKAEHLRPRDINRFILLYLSDSKYSIDGRCRASIQPPHKQPTSNPTPSSSSSTTASPNTQQTLINHTNPYSMFSTQSTPPSRLLHSFSSKDTEASSHFTP